jgi:hypothetical protein
MFVQTKELKQYISVAAIFHDGKAMPVWFGLDGKRYDVQEVCYTWKSMQGAVSLQHYSVWDGENTYILDFNTKNLTWSLSIKEAVSR